MATGPSSFSVSRNRGCRVGVGVKNAEHSSRGKYKCCQGEGGPRPHRRGKGGSGRSVCGGWTGKRGKGVGGCVCTGQGGRAGGSRAFAPICACAENETKGMTPRGKQEVGARGQAHRPTPKPGLNTPRTRPQAPFPSPRPPGTGLPPPQNEGKRLLEAIEEAWATTWAPTSARPRATHTGKSNAYNAGPQPVSLSFFLVFISSLCLCLFSSLLSPPPPACAHAFTPSSPPAARPAPQTDTKSPACFRPQSGR